MIQNSSDGRTSLADLRAEDFEPLVGRDVSFGDTGFTLVLARVERARGTLPADLPRAPFTLIFTGPKGATFLTEGLYRCAIGDRASFDLHVAPIHTFAADRQDYQAVFG